VKKLITLISVIIGILIVAGFVFLWLWLQGRDSQKTDIQVEIPNQVTPGIPFDAKIIIKNNSTANLTSPTIALSLDGGVAFYGDDKDNRLHNESLETIEANSAIEKDIRLISYGDSNTVAKLKTTVEYQFGSIKSGIKKDIATDIAIGPAPLLLDALIPEKILSGENLELTLGYKNTGLFNFDNLRLTVIYPPSFSLQQSTLKPDVDNNVWLLGGLNQGSQNEIKLQGIMEGPDNATFDFKFIIEAEYNGHYYPVTQTSKTIVINASLINITLTANDQQTPTAQAGDTLRYNITITNNSGVALQGVTVRAQLVGEMFDFSTISSEAFYSAINKTLTWDRTLDSQLTSLEAAESRQFQFSIGLVHDYPIKRLNDKNFVTSLRVTVSSPTVPYYLKADKTVSQAQLDTKIKGRAGIQSLGYFRDTSAGIINTGPFPPQSEVPTQYTIHWRLSTFATDFEAITMAAQLEPWVKFIKSVNAPGDSTIDFDDNTRTVTWQINKVIANTGVVTQPLEAIFQIEATPSALYKNRYLPLVRIIQMNAKDSFTGEPSTGSNPAIDTSLPGDPTVQPGDGVVR